MWISRFLKRVTVTSSPFVLILKTHSFRFLHCSESHYRCFESTLRHVFYLLLVLSHIRILLGNFLIWKDVNLFIVYRMRVPWWHKEYWSAYEASTAKQLKLLSKQYWVVKTIIVFEWLCLDFLPVNVQSMKILIHDS